LKTFLGLADYQLQKLAGILRWQPRFFSPWPTCSGGVSGCWLAHATARCKPFAM
jgi:hypothetical protein